MIPYFQGGLEWKASTKQSKEPFYEEYFWLDWEAFHLLGYIWVKVVKKQFKSTTDSLNESFSHTEYLPEEVIAKDHVTKHIESLDFAKDGDENDSRVGHTLNIADIRPEDMENL